MQAEKRYATLILESLLDQRRPGELEQRLQERLAALESNYAKMEGEYFRKIKELKGTLGERTRRQAALSAEVGGLREEFKLHQQEILRITEELAAEKGRSNEPKTAKKNNSPGLLKTSLEGGRKTEKRMSPSVHPTEIDTSVQALPRKGYSPTTNPKKPLLLPKKQQPAKAVQPTADRSPPANHPKTNHSPRTSAKSSTELKGFLVNSLKQFEKQKAPLPTNASPKRVLRRSPAASGSSNPTPTPKTQKKLGRIKEEIMQAF